MKQKEKKTPLTGLWYTCYYQSITIYIANKGWTTMDTSFDRANLAEDLVLDDAAFFAPVVTI